MKLSEHKIILKGKLEFAWEKLVDWRTMPDWDTFMKSVSFDGPLKVGSTGQLVVQSGQKFTLKVTSFTPMKEYTDEFSILGSRFIFHHELETKSPGEIAMTFSVEGTGLIPFFLQNSLANDFNAKLPDLMNLFKTQFEASERKTEKLA